MFYTIEAPNGKLIVIDGGYYEDAERVRNVILQHEGIVDYWIITHPHPDHVGAFNAIYQDLNGIAIMQIYASDINYDYYYSRQFDYDHFETFEMFLELMEGTEELTYLYEGDTLNIAGLRLEVLSAANQMTEYPCNDGSLVMKLTAKKESFLITGDTGIGMSNYLLEKYGDKLKSDFLQLSHHGNYGLKNEVYHKVAPKIAFADAPRWLRDISWNTPETIQFLEDIGAKVYSFETTPNRFKFY